MIDAVTAAAAPAVDTVPDLLRSSVACALTDFRGIIQDASPALRAVVPNAIALLSASLEIA